MADYKTMMRDLDRKIEERDRNAESSLRELFQTRRKVWNMYPRVGALEDRMYMRDTNPEKYETLTTLEKGSGSYMSPGLRSYGSVGDLTHEIPRTRSRRASYDYGSYSRPLAGRSYGTSSATDKYETASLSGYRLGDNGDDDAATSGYKSYKSSGDKWETQSLADYPVRTRPYSTSSYSRPRRSKYGYDTDDYDTTSRRSYKDDDANLEAMTRWKTSNSASRRNYLDSKKYDEWSSPRYSPRAPLNPYLHEADLTTSYQSPRTLVQPEYVDDDEEVENLSLSRYNKVSLTDRYNPESSKNYFMDDPTYHRSKTPKSPTSDYSYSRSYKSSDTGLNDVPKPSSLYSTSKYTSDNTDYDSTSRSRPRYTSYTNGYSSPTRRYGDISGDNSPSRYSSASKYDDDDDRLSDVSTASTRRRRRDANLSSLSVYTRRTPRVDADSSIYTRRTPRVDADSSSLSAYTRRKPRADAGSYLSTRRNYTSTTSRDARIANLVDRKPRSSYPVYSDVNEDELGELQKTRFGHHLPVRSYGSMMKYSPSSQLYLGTDRREYERDPMGYLYSVISAQAKILTYCLSNMNKKY